jgi:hypothetical protein
MTSRVGDEAATALGFIRENLAMNGIPEATISRTDQPSVRSALVKLRMWVRGPGEVLTDESEIRSPPTR